MNKKQRQQSEFVWGTNWTDTNLDIGKIEKKGRKVGCRGCGRTIVKNAHRYCINTRHQYGRHNLTVNAYFCIGCAKENIEYMRKELKTSIKTLSKLKRKITGEMLKEDEKLLADQELIEEL